MSGAEESPNQSKGPGDRALTPALREIPARVSRDHVVAGWEGWSSFRVELPENYEHPQRPESEEWDEIKQQDAPPADIVARFDAADINKIEIGLQETGKRPDINDSYRFSLEFVEGRWLLDARELPDPILNMIKTALAHEVSINPNAQGRTAVIHIRVQTAKRLGKKENTAHIPHRDYIGTPEASIYLLTSAPTTQQYVGTYHPSMKEQYARPGNLSRRAAPKTWWEKQAADHLAWSSLLPWTLYRVTTNWLHNTPSTEEAGKGLFPRLFVRIAFV